MRTSSAVSPAIIAAAVVLFAGCPAGKKVIPKPSYAAETTMRLVPSHCKGGVCPCRALDSDNVKEKGIAAGHKRFELRLPKTPSALWVEIEKWGVYYKPPDEVAVRCFYVDLTAGRHRITVYGEKRDLEVGLQSGLTIYEYGEPEKGGPSWYRSFHFACGMGASSCTKDELIAFRRAQKALPRGALDPCGSVMVKGVSFGGTRAQKGDEKYQDVTLRLSLKIYAFKPYRPPRSPKCKAPVSLP